MRAADCQDMKGFFEELKAVFSPRNASSTPVRSKDGQTLLTDRPGIVQRWKDHFVELFNQPSQMDLSVLDDLTHD